jgi:hypothetical protein
VRIPKVLRVVTIKPVFSGVTPYNLLIA